MREGEPTSVPTAQSQTPPKPLHIQVAEALDTLHILGPLEGLTPAGYPLRYCTVHAGACGEYDYITDYDGRVICPDYDTNWSATGPLIEELQMRITPKHFSSWEAELLSEGVFAAGPTPLVAACRLIVALAAATPTGKLEMPQ